ncbi:MAG: hypothetical protein HGA22_11990, partial [Clostridiales bacterium]|nr:hypothetical protein [Clostridiales bacterium]
MLFFGAGRKSITPEQGLLEDLRGLRDTSFDRVVDDLFVRTFYFKNDSEELLFIAYDLDKAPYPRETMEAVHEKTGIIEENIFIFGIHNHSAPVTGFRPFEGPNFILTKSEKVQIATGKYEKFLEKTTMEAVEEAISKCQPARMGCNSGECHINVNRYQDYHYKDSEGPDHIEYGIGADPLKYADHTLFVMKVESLEGKPLGFFTNYAMHNIAMIWNQCGNDGRGGISSDIGGNTSKYLEELYEGCVAIWSSGAAGDINPVISNQISYPDPLTGRRVEYNGSGSELPLILLKMLTARHLADIKQVIGGISCSGQEAPIRSAIRWSETPSLIKDILTGEQTYKVRLHLTRLGDCLFFGFSGELFSSLGKLLKELSPYKDTVI